MCVCKFWKNEHSQTHKIGPFYSKTCEIAIAHRKSKNHRTHAHRKFQPKWVLTRTSQLATCDRTSQVMPWLLPLTGGGLYTNMTKIIFKHIGTPMFMISFVLK